MLRVCCFVIACVAGRAAVPGACCATVDASLPAAFANCGGSRPAGLPFARRSPVLSQKGQVASAHPLASQAGLDILKAGGSAVDAAIATNAFLGVVEPMMNGLGGDLMAIIWSEEAQTLSGYNGAGRASASFSLAEMQAAVAADGAQYIPTLGPLAVTVPGAPRGWCDLSARFGKLPLATVLAPAIAAAEEGTPVPQIIAEEWAEVPNSTAMTSNGLFPHARDGWASVFLLNGSTPREGDIFKNPALAQTLRAIASGGCDAFYGPGPVSSALLALSATAGIRLTAADLAEHKGEWVTPISTTYRNSTTLFELPPNPQGAAALEMLNILELFDLESMGFNSADYLHAHVEAKKLAFADASFFFADPAFASVPLEGIISKAYAKTRYALINMSAAAQTDSPGAPPSVSLDYAGGGTSPSKDEGGHRRSLESMYGGDTTYFTAADSRGNMVSMIQSLYTGFGSGIVSPSLGFTLQSRGALFTLDATHANVYAPGKRPFHTIMPGFAFRNGLPWLSFGVMGGFYQPQGHAQIVANLVDFGMNVEEAGSAARYDHDGSTQPTGQQMVNGGTLLLEAGVCDATVSELEARGHVITRGPNLGGYQAIERTPLAGGNGFVYRGATEFRKDGLVASW